MKGTNLHSERTAAEPKTEVGIRTIGTVSESAEQPGLQLNPEDYVFIDYVINDITLEGHLPFTLPTECMPRVIVDAANWFYRNYNEAVEEKMFMIRREDFQQNGYNKEIQLPKQIEAVIQIFPCQTNYMGISPYRFIMEPMYGAVNSLATYNQSYNSPYRQLMRDQAFEQTVVKMFEWASLKTLFRQGVRFDFNINTKKLRVLSDLKQNIVLSTYQRIPLADLYQDINFQRYVIASTMEQLKRLIHTFDFKYPGEVQINVEEMEKRGTEMKKEIEEQIKKEGQCPDFFIVK